MAYRNAALIFCLLMLTACFDEGKTETEQLESYHTALEKWRRINQQNLLESLNLLKETTNKYLDGKVTRVTWQNAWIQAHRRWLENSSLGFVSELDQIDAWPIAPGFLDSIVGYPQTGIINDISLNISSQILRQQHQITDSREVSLGFHVLEYYVFARPEADLHGKDEPCSRRRILVGLVAEMLLLDVSQMLRNPEHQREPLLEKMLNRTHTLLSEFNRIGEHGQFSESSLANISVPLQSMKKLTQKPVDLSNYLTGLDKELTKVFLSSLYEAIDLLDSPSGLSEASSSRLLLLLSSLSHNLEDFLRLSERRSIAKT